MKPLLVLLLFLCADPALAAGDDRAAEVLVERAVAAYKSAEYAKAGAFFLEAYRLSNAPAQLRNAAKAYQQAEDLDQADALWSELAALDGIGPSERSEAEAQRALIAERRKASRAEEDARLAREEAARARTATVAAAPPPAAPPPPPPPLQALEQEQRGFHLPVGPVVTIAVGLAVAVGGGALYWHSDERLRQLDERLEVKDSDDAIIGIELGEAQDELDRINRERRIAIGLGGAAGAIAVAGAVWWLLDLGSVEPVAAVSDSGAIAGVRGAW